MGGSASYRLAKKIANAKINGAPQDEIDELERQRQEALDAERAKRQSSKEKSFRDKVNEAKTKAELWTVFSEKYGKGNVTTGFVRKNDFELVKRAVNTLDELEEKYPFMKGYIKKLTNIYAGGAMAAWIDEGKKFHLNPNFWNADNAYLYSGPDRGFHPPNMTPESIVAHEFGHAIQGYLMDKMAEWANNASSPADMMKAVDIWANLIDGTALEYIERKALDSLGLKHSLSMGRFTISKYAYKPSGGNPSFEAFSEAFSDVYSNGDNAADVSKAYVNALLEEIKFYGG